MLQLLAQTYSSSYELSTTENTGLAAFFAAYFIFVIALVVVQIVAMWKVFEKMGIEGWKAIIPVYNMWVLAEAVGKPGWWALTVFLAWIPLLNLIAWIVPTVLFIIVMLELGKGFGKDTVWSVFLLIIFSLIGLLMLAFGNDKFDKRRLTTPKTA